METSLKRKRVLVLGFGKSGVAAAKLLMQCGARVTIYVDKPLNGGIDEPLRFDVIVDIERKRSDLFFSRWDFVVKSPGISNQSWFVTLLKAQCVPIISEIELGCMLAKQHKFIAITGTNGKTTTTNLVYEIVKKNYPSTTFIAGNVGTALSEVILNHNLLQKKDCYVILEISNYQLIDTFSLKPHIASILNLSPDHLNDFTLEEYYCSKMRIFTNMDMEDTFIINYDDINIERYMKQYPVNCKTQTFSLTNHNCDCCFDGENIIYKGSKILNVKEMRIVGLHNIQNAMVAISITSMLGIPINIIQSVISNFSGVEHRLEFVKSANGVRYYNDSKATNIEATEVALQSFDSPIILLVGGFEKYLSVSSLIKYMSKVKLVIGYGACGSRFIEELHHNPSIIVTNLEQAVEVARKHAVTGDVVLLSPATSSLDQFSSFEERGLFFKSLIAEVKQ